MNTISVSEARMKLSALVDAVNRTEEELFITKNGRPVAVLVSPEEFASWRETVWIRNEPEFLDEIRRGLTALETDKASLYGLDELLPGS